MLEGLSTLQLQLNNDKSQRRTLQTGHPLLDIIIANSWRGHCSTPAWLSQSWLLQVKVVPAVREDSRSAQTVAPVWPTDMITGPVSPSLPSLCLPVLRNSINYVYLR